MLDLNFVRGHLPQVEENLRRRGADPAAQMGSFAELDARRRAAITEAETLKAQRNRLSEQVARQKKAGEDATAAIEETRALKEKLDQLDRAAAELDESLRALLARVPNLLRPEVPGGRDDGDNVVVKEWGQRPAFGFAPRPHWELGETLGILDLDRAAKVSGARFAVYFGAGARLERALAQFMLDLHTGTHGYVEVLPPFLVSERSLFGTGQLPKFEQDLFRCGIRGQAPEEASAEASEQAPRAGESPAPSPAPGLTPGLTPTDHWLIPTAEVPLTNLHRDEVLEGARLPLSYAAWTPCFRSEAGSYGRDVRGIIRQHQFQKVELVKFTRPEDSDEEHERLTRHAETVLERLGLPYRRVLLCAGDTGFSSAKTFDLEVWLPGQQLYREISSCSNFDAFQARRANIRFRGAQGRPEPVHTLNGSGLAVGRTWVAVVENYQQADGSVRIPEVLVPYMGGLSVIEPAAAGMRE